jgi:hypothetical protein
MKKTRLALGIAGLVLTVGAFGLSLKGQTKYETKPPLSGTVRDDPHPPCPPPPMMCTVD